MVRARLEPLVTAVRRVARGLLGLLPGPPGDPAVADPLLDGLDRLPPDEQQARRDAWLAQERRGRGDGGG
jgi:hypothetical protein